MSPVDWLILAPVIPTMPIFATWMLPWERWIPWGRIPKAFLGPYALYLSFVIWHFSRSWWAFGVWAIIGTVTSVMAIIEKVKRQSTPVRSRGSQ
jgi:hypothetical protein